ncbi:hypothetical protein GCM10009682_58000 [Luedemannella flava]|uniref:CsbD family protein n=1 Tax=Luedemannella flava TaxID=349316 RepID=A0ABN2MQ37_9ACTN
MSRKRRKEVSRLVDHAWGNLTSAASTGGDKAKQYGAKVGAGSREARRRADAALDALSGKRPPVPWGLVAGVAALGVALGWAATVFGRRAVTTAQQQLTADPEDITLYADEVTPAH